MFRAALWAKEHILLIGRHTFAINMPGLIPSIKIVSDSIFPHIL